MELCKSRTRENLNNAMNAEARVCFLYRIYANEALKAERPDVAAAFETALRNEMAHGKLWYSFLHPNAPDFAASLADAARGEHFEWTDMYADYAETARQEGFDNIARLFRLAGDVEHSHETLFDTAMGKLQSGGDFHSAPTTTWICQNCGHRQTGPDAPDLCPLCAHPRGFFRPSEG